MMPGWHSAIFPPYFVAGAIFSGIAMAILLLARAAPGLSAWSATSSAEHFDLLAKLLLAMSLVMTFVYATEFFMAFYRGSETEAEVFRWRATGTYAPVFWLVVACNSVAPLALLLDARAPQPAGDDRHRRCWSRSGMWFERFMFIVTTLAHNYDPVAWRNYTPTVRELVHLPRRLRLVLMLFLLFIKILPCDVGRRDHAGRARLAPRTHRRCPMR